MTDERKPETPGISEVSPKFVDEAEAATAAPPSSASVADDPLIALGHQWKEVYGKWVEADGYPDTSDRGAIKKYEKERTVLLLAICQLEDQAAEVAAQTVDGVLAQLRMAGTHYHLMERDGEQWANTYAKLTWQAWDGLERLAGESRVAKVAQPDTALVALWEEWQHLWEANKKAVEEAQDDKLADETFTALMAVEKRMEDMPARTAAGVWNKLQVAGVWIDTNRGSPDEDKMGVVERLTLSALADLERLTGQGFVAVPVVTMTPSSDADRLLFALIENMEATEEIAGNMVPDGRDGTYDRLNERSRDLSRQIMDTRAQSIQGLTWKLRQLVSTLELEEGVSKYEMDMARSALADACGLAGEGATTRRQTVTTAAAASSASDPVAQIGRDLATIWRQVWRNDDEKVSVEAHSPESTRLERLGSHLADRTEALEAMAAEIQACSLEGAMVQIMLAHAEADIMGASTEESSEAQMRTISKLLYSALAALEQATGVPREELGGKAYLTRDLDPHALVAGDETKSTA